jgi:hypothetical protein
MRGGGGPGRNPHFCQTFWQEFLTGMCSRDKGEGRVRKVEKEKGSWGIKKEKISWWNRERERNLKRKRKEKE